MTATCLDKDLAYFPSSGSIYEVILEFTDFKVSGTIRREISTNNHNSFPTSAVFPRTSYFLLALVRMVVFFLSTLRQAYHSVL